jgi:hypothetical protein
MVSIPICHKLKLAKLLLIFHISFSLFSSELNDEQMIEKLLVEVEKSELTFVRNGKNHNSKQARSHLEYKYNYVKNGFWFWQKAREVDVKSFIDKIASGSSTTGKEYFIKDKKGELIPAKKWLNDKLLQIKSNQ